MDAWFTAHHADHPGHDALIGGRLRCLGVPVLFVFSGGDASDDVGLHAVNMLAGFPRG